MKEQLSSAEFNDLKFQIPKRMKYRNVKTEYDGIIWDSKKELAYYKKLQLYVKSGDVVSFERQVRYNFELNGVKMGFYKLDFLVEWASGAIRYVDVKGMKTPVYQLKKKMMKAFHGITITEL